MKHTRAKSQTGRLSEQQLDILTFIALRSAVSPWGHSFINWSPTAYVSGKNSKATRDEVAAVSRRVSSLAERNLVERKEGQVALTERGWSVLVKRRKDFAPELIELNEARKAFEQLLEQRMHVHKTFLLIGEVLQGNYKMTWIDDPGGPEGRETPPPEEKRPALVRYTFDTLFFLDGQMNNELNERLSRWKQIGDDLIKRLNLPTS